MNKKHDIIRVMVEMGTFTSLDMQKAFDISDATASDWLNKFKDQKWLESERVGHAILWAATPKADALVRKIGPLDENERLLLTELISEGISYAPCSHNGGSVFAWGWHEVGVGYHWTEYCGECDATLVHHVSPAEKGDIPF